MSSLSSRSVPEQSVGSSNLWSLWSNPWSYPDIEAGREHRKGQTIKTWERRMRKERGKVAAVLEGIWKRAGLMTVSEEERREKVQRG